MHERVDIEKCVYESFGTLTKIYKNLLFPLLFLYILGWVKWATWAFFENYAVLVLVCLMASYPYGCLFYRCLKDCDRNGHNVTRRYISFKKYSLFFLTELVLSIGFIIGLLFCFVPGFIFAIKFSMARLIVLDQDENLFVALKESYKLTKGHTISLSILIVPAFAMWAIGRLAGNSLSGVPTGDINLTLVVFSSCLGIISCFYILPLTCIVLSKAYFMLSDD